MQFLVRALWAISVLGFLYNLYTTYGNLQQRVGVQLGEGVLQFSRNEYFFFFLALAMVANISLIMLGNAFRFLPKSYLFIPQRAFWTATLQNRRAVNQILGNWTWAIASTANYFFIFWMLVVEDGYHFEGNSITAVEWFYKPGLFLAGLLIVPVFRLMIKNINLFQRQERE